MKTKVCLLVLLSFLSVNLVANNDDIWGPTGHRVTGKIAEMHLTKKARKKIEKLLKGESLAFVSTYADEIKSDKKYNKYYTWHYVNMPLDGAYETSEKNPKGDLVTGINHCVKVLKDEKSSINDKRFCLKMLVHLIGDLHQPLHVGRKEDKGGNSFQVQWHKRGTNLHRVWDEQLIGKWNMSYIELANNAQDLSKSQIAAIEKGSIIDWIGESHQLAKRVYASAEVGENLRYKYSYEFFPVVREQLQKGGIRLAKLLNDIFC